MITHSTRRSVDRFDLQHKMPIPHISKSAVHSYCSSRRRNQHQHSAQHAHPIEAASANSSQTKLSGMLHRTHPFAASLPSLLHKCRHTRHIRLVMHTEGPAQHVGVGYGYPPSHPSVIHAADCVPHRRCTSLGGGFYPCAPREHDRPVACLAVNLPCTQPAGLIDPAQRLLSARSSERSERCTVRAKGGGRAFVPVNIPHSDVADQPACPGPFNVCLCHRALARDKEMRSRVLAVERGPEQRRHPHGAEEEYAAKYPGAREQHESWVSACAARAQRTCPCEGGPPPPPLS